MIMTAEVSAQPGSEAKPADEAVREGNAKLREPLSPEELARFERYVSEMFTRLGMNLDLPGTGATPARWLRAMMEMTAGYDGDPKLETVFPGECPACPDEEMEHVVEGPISFFALCEHHGLPIQGNAWIGYLAGDEILGISKLTRIVRLYARRFTTQERLTHQVASHLMELIRPQGVVLYLEAHHACTQARGVEERQSRTRTYATRGAYSTNPRKLEEFMALCGFPLPGG